MNTKRIFKFGGASVNSAERVRNLAAILKSRKDRPFAVVVSAMGKTTNALEEIVNETHATKRIDNTRLSALRNYHLGIMASLFEPGHAAFKTFEKSFSALVKNLVEFSCEDYDFLYDQTVSYGEVFSTQIISAYLNEEGISNQWTFAGEIIKTGNNYREAAVDWEASLQAAHRAAVPEGRMLLTQGFLGSDPGGYTTTLGREGSDYTAAILAYLFDAAEVVIWKDVPGMMNADPHYFEDARKLEAVSFREAIELSYFGAKVIHPKTLQPLKQKNIPLRVKSFLHPGDSGTLISSNQDYDRSFPSFILKRDQVLISITPLDFSFIIEENLSHIFAEFSKFGVKVHLMQNSAINFSVCVDAEVQQVPALIKSLKKYYKVRYNDKVDLLTIRNFNPEIEHALLNGKEILLEQRTRYTERFVIRNKKK